MQDFGQWLPQPQNTVDLCFSSIIMQSQIDSSIEKQARTCAVISTEKESTNSLVIENDNEPIQGIDLNKTPLQKPKRKKHRPKVIKEGKEVKTPKSTNPKPPKGNGEQPSGKRKYVRRKGLSSPVNQSLVEFADSHNRTELKPVRRCLNFDGEEAQENGNQGSLSISTGHRDSRGQVACHFGATTSSIYSAPDLVADAQEVPADSVPKGVLFDLNYSINQVQNEHSNFMENPGQCFQPGTGGLGTTLLDFCANTPVKSMYDLNSSRNQLQNGLNNFAECLLSSPQTCTSKTTKIDQMFNGYGIPEIPITPAQHFEREVVRKRLNELARKNDYLKFATNSSQHMETTLGLRDSCKISDILAMGMKGDHNVVNGTWVSSDMNFHHTYKRDFGNDCHATRSRTAYFPETFKRMRTEKHGNWTDGAVGNFSSPSTYLPANWNINQVSAINSEVFTLADAQRLMAVEKSRASQRMLASGLAGNDMLKRSNLLQHNNKSAPDGTTSNGCIATPDKQFRYVNTEHTQFPNTLISPAAKYISISGSHQLHSLESDMVKRSELLAQLHKASQQDHITNNNCIATPAKQFGSLYAERIRSPITPISPSTGNDITRSVTCPISPSTGNDITRSVTCPISPSTGNNITRSVTCPPEASRETVAAKPNEKRKRGRPRKEKVGPVKRKSSKDRRNDLVQHEVISCISGPPTGGAEGLVSVRNGEKMSCLWATSDHDYFHNKISGQTHGESIISGAIERRGDPLDVLIQKMKFLHISKADGTVATGLQNALVPYKGEYGAMVPFEGTVKKRRSRAKVNLDPVTNLMWKLLMGQDMSDGLEEMNKDKEKWLDEERKNFRGRVDSFIARMHLVQGDRRFSPWKGSVVDSVVGVFLTQNVSDHLSSSAFMALAAKFAAKSETPRKPGATVFNTSPEQKDSCFGPFGDACKLQGKVFFEEISGIGSLITTEEKEGTNSDELFGSTSGHGGAAYSVGVHSNSWESLNGLHESRPSTLVTGIGSANVVEAEDGSLEDVVSSQNSVISSQSSPDYLFHTTDHVGSSSLSNFGAEEFMVRNMSNSMGSSTSYTELLKMQDLQSKSIEKIGSSECHRFDLLPVSGVDNGTLLNEVQNLSATPQSVCSSICYLQNGQLDFQGVTNINHLDKSFFIGLDTMNDSNVAQADVSFYGLLSASGVADRSKTKITESSCTPSYAIDESSSHKKSTFSYESAQESDLISPIVKQYLQPLIGSETQASAREHPFSQNSLSRNEMEAPFRKQHACSNLQEECTARTKQVRGEKFQPAFSLQENYVRVQVASHGKQDSSNLLESQNAKSEVLQGAAPKFIEESKNTQKGSSEVRGDGLKAKRAKAGAAKKKTYDWDSLRKEVFCNGGKKERGHDAKDSLDWEAVRQADVKEISETIRERGMNNMLAERIKEFLNRLVNDHGSIDLEWLRDVQPDKAKDYLLSIRGLGLKSVECVRLLTLHHLAFPVDTNVGRICVRLGWVPLQPLPESLQLHLLELYPMLENIQKYLWPRLCKLDQRTLYELHYQMITFGKVFCTKSKPNCNACPMRAECKHFASAFASARLALPGPEEKSLVTSATRVVEDSCHQRYINSRPAVQLEWNTVSRESIVWDNHQPIIEEPASPEPEPESAEIKERAIEDAFLEDPDEIPTIKLNFEEFTQNLKSYMQANNIEIEDADMSKALVAITPEAASIPTPKLKNVSRLRTEHQVYELPDSHLLLQGFDQREPDDPCPYLLSIWTPGETAQSIEAPQTFCNSQETGRLCERATCFSCNSIKEVKAQIVRATLLIPCRTAMRGSFPLNGTYFQVNEVFADHHTSRNPIDVPRSWIWNLPRRTVYFGTSIPTIFKGLTTEDIQHCFWRGFVCVRGFDRQSRAPRPLYARLHFPASKVNRNKRSAPSAAAGEER